MQVRRASPLEVGDPDYSRWFAFCCSDCGIDDTCALCTRCFNASDHTGHDVTYTIHSSGCGCCDCGDPEAWKPEGGIKCGYHSARSVEEAAAFEADRAKKVVPLPNGCRAAIERHVEAALDFLLAVIDRAPEQVVPPSDAASIRRTQLSRREQALRDGTADLPGSETKSIDPDADDLLTPTMSGTLGHTSPSGSRQPGVNWKNLWPPTARRASDKGKGKGTSGEAAVPPSASPPGPASPVKGSRAAPVQSGSAGPWGVVLWNDEKHSYAQVISKVASTLR